MEQPAVQARTVSPSFLTERRSRRRFLSTSKAGGSRKNWVTLMRRSLKSASVSRGLSVRNRVYSPQSLNAVDAHSPLDPPIEGGKLVPGKVPLGAEANDGEDLLHVAALVLHHLVALLRRDSMGLSDVLDEGAGMSWGART